MSGNRKASLGRLRAHGLILGLFVGLVVAGCADGSEPRLNSDFLRGFVPCRDEQLEVATEPLEGVGELTVLGCELEEGSTTPSAYVGLLELGEGVGQEDALELVTDTRTDAGRPNIVVGPVADGNRVAFWANAFGVDTSFAERVVEACDCGTILG